MSVTARQRARFLGVDIARLGAIVGMIAAHTWAFWGLQDQGAGSFIAVIVYFLSAGFPSTLFAVIGGASLTFASTRAFREHGVRGVVLSAFVRGLVVALFGAALALVDSHIIPVLVPFGVAMMVASVFLAMPSAVVALVAVVLGSMGGYLNVAARVAAHDVAQEGGGISFTTFALDPLLAFRAIFVTGVYPVSTWLVYMLIGMLVARGLLAARDRGRLVGTGLAMWGIGAGVAIVAFLTAFFVTALEFPREYVEQHYGATASDQVWAQFTGAPHTGTPMDILITAGAAVSTIGLCTALFDRNGTRGRFVRALGAAGAASLTVYSVHYVVTLPLGGTPIPFFGAPGFNAFLLQLVIVLAIGLTLHLLGRKGPLEAGVSWVAKSALKFVPRVPDITELPRQLPQPER